MDGLWPVVGAVAFNVLAIAFGAGCLWTNVKNNSRRIKRVEQILDWKFNGGPRPGPALPEKSKERR